MSDSAFAATWQVKKLVAPISDEPAARYCSLGRKCLKATKGRAGVVSGKAEYCSPACRGRAKFLTQKPPAAQVGRLGRSQNPRLQNVVHFRSMFMRVRQESGDNGMDIGGTEPSSRFRGVFEAIRRLLEEDMTSRWQNGPYKIAAPIGYAFGEVIPAVPEPQVNKFARERAPVVGRCRNDEETRADFDPKTGTLTYQLYRNLVEPSSFIESCNFTGHSSAKMLCVRS
jgi:hypothetical protein